MPVTKSATRALRKDRRRTIVNKRIRSKLRAILKKVNATKDSKLIPEAYSVIDRSAKKNIIHPNKAARLKSQLSKKVAPAAK